MELCGIERGGLPSLTVGLRWGGAISKRDVHFFKDGGAMRDRTADLFRAREALSQLSYSPGALAAITKSAK